MRNNRDIIQVLKKFLDFYPRISVKQALLLLLIAENDGEEQKVIVRKADMNSTTASKHIRMFSNELDAKKKPGMGLISVRPMAMSLTSNTLHLTEKGTKLMESL